MNAARSRNNRNPDVLRLLIDLGADVNAVDNNGRTPLMLAARYSTAAPHTSNLGIFEFLINNGADVSMKCEEGRNALNYAEANGNLGRHARDFLREKTLSQMR